MSMLARRKRLLCCCDPPVTCEDTLIDFSSGMGPFPHTATDPPWSIDSGELVFDPPQGFGGGEVLWTVPVEDTGVATIYRVEATGNFVTLPPFDGGVTIAFPDWQAWWGEENNRLILRYLDADDNYDVIDAGPTGPLPITLTLEAKSVGYLTPCREWARLTAKSSNGHDVTMMVQKNIEVTEFPSEIQMGVFAAPSSFEPEGDSPFPAVCPPGDVCHGGMQAQGTFENGLCGCGPSTESATHTSTPLSCLGSPPVLPGFDPANGYYIADLPFTIGTNWRTILYYDETAKILRCWVLDNNNCPTWEGVPVSTDCDPFAARFHFVEPVSTGCCMDSIGDAYIDWSAPNEGCEASPPRRFDNVHLTACAGAESGDCPDPDGAYDPTWPYNWAPYCDRSFQPPDIGHTTARCWEITIPSGAEVGFFDGSEFVWEDVGGAYNLYGPNCCGICLGCCFHQDRLYPGSNQRPGVWMGVGSGGTWELFVGGPGGPKPGMPVIGTHNIAGPNTFDTSSLNSLSSYRGWPSSVTVSPRNCT